jgi:hypothetical protein
LAQFTTTRQKFILPDISSSRETIMKLSPNGWFQLSTVEGRVIGMAARVEVKEGCGLFTQW